MELLLGCGHRREKAVFVEGKKSWENLVTLDISPSCNPDVVHDLEITPWPFPSNTFNEVHAYEVLEHLGRQGDEKSFFAHFGEIWRILKPGGLFMGSSPTHNSMGLWGDPSHKRAITPMSLSFLSRKIYERDLGKTPMTDFRESLIGDFDILHAQETPEGVFIYCIQAVKET